VNKTVEINSKEAVLVFFRFF